MVYLIEHTFFTFLMFNKILFEFRINFLLRYPPGSRKIRILYYKCFLVRGVPLKPLHIHKVTLKLNFLTSLLLILTLLVALSLHQLHITFQSPSFFLKTVTSKALICHITSADFHITFHIILTSMSHYF